MSVSASFLKRSLFIGLALVLLVTLVHVLYADLGLPLASVCVASQPASLKQDHPEFLGRFLKRFHSPEGQPENEEPEPAEDYSLLDEAHLTKNGGFLRLRQPDGPVGFYGVSMFHQLHCLEMLREHIAGADKNNSGHSHHDAHGAENGAEQAEESFHHLLHCIDYLSQAVVCAADDTIEPARIEKMKDGRRTAIIDGDRTAHHCRDARRVSHIVRASQDNPITVSSLVPGDTVTVLRRRAGRGHE